MKRVIIETPAEDSIDIEYLRDCIEDSLALGESPFTDCFIGQKPGYQWWGLADKVVFYTDHGWTEKMRKARIRASRFGKRIVERSLNET